ncbi:expressed unknown protein [Seminavis robusta]|uniref:Uncharacterized protein n=1 Tax=Seminavis robusta TaxID=568900 RepID=A0A9N8DEA1_9STRA|nr:expressed unknown protein [Seminavis robusta]|eukprot:Sro54_g031700.1 n/a (1002) ;mRNA; f:23037-26139
MASFLSFVYRRQTSAPASFDSSTRRGAAAAEARHSLPSSIGKTEDITELDGNRPQFLPPGVSSSGSSESAWAAPHNLSSHDESEDSSVVVLDDDEDDRFLSSPFTPEGLLPRKSVDSMRRNLKLEMPPRALDKSMSSAHTEAEFSGVAKILAGRVKPQGNAMKSPARASSKSQNIYRDAEGDSDEDNMILPPPQYMVQSTSTFGSSIQSPPVSTSSFYSKHSSKNHAPVAMSPVLQVGQARTAVGALVALREAANSHPNASIAMSSSSAKQAEQKTTAKSEPAGQKKKSRHQHHLTKQHSFPMSVLPPRPKEFDQVEQQHPVEEEEVAPPRDENANVPYHPSAIGVRRRSDGVFNTASIGTGLEPSRTGGVSQFQRYGVHTLDNNRIHLSSSMSSKSSMISTGQQMDEQLSTARTWAAAGSLALSDALATANSEPKAIAYDEVEEDFDDLLVARKFRNQEMQKERMKLEDTFFELEEEHESEYTRDEEDYGEEASEYYPEQEVEETHYRYKETDGIDFEDALLRRKARNQRHETEKFLHEVVARLRDNLDLVADIEAAASRTVAAMGSWFVKTPIDTENLLTGFSFERRNKLLSCIDSILNEMALAQPEEFIVSPSKVPVMAVSHDTLTQALHFCRALIVSAIPRNEREKMVKELPCDEVNSNQQHLFVWKSLPELNHALGIVAPPQTPVTVRGGGTSLFSLPEESGAETPHTSNVSLATSITSVNTYNAPRQRANQSARPQLILQQDGLQLRQTVQVISSLLQKLSLACMDLGEVNAGKQSTDMARKYVLACDNIKQLYLRLLTIKKEDAKALMGTFYLESQSPESNAMIAREVSADEEDMAETHSKDMRAVRTVPMFSGRFQGQNRGQTTLLVDRVGNSMSFGGPTPMPSPRRSSYPLEMPRQQPRESRGMSLFSPSTEDMRSKASDYSIPYELDDLRRQVGSYDRDDSDDTEERDGPCENGFETREEAEEWRAMYENVSLAASSLRSLGQPQAKSTAR